MLNLESDSDEEVRVIFEDSRDGFSEANNGEPPRRRMRLDPSVSSSALTTNGMNLRSGALYRQLQESCNPAPPSPAYYTPTSISPVSHSPDSVDNDDDSSFGQPSSPYGYGDSVPSNFDTSSVPSQSSPFFRVDSPISSILSGNSFDVEDRTIELNSDLDDLTAGSFESYNADDLSDVPVNRSPAFVSPSSASEDSVDGESLYGAANDVEVVSQGGDGEGNPGGWQRRRLQRRNAIVLENTESQQPDSEDEPSDRRNSTASEPADLTKASDNPSCATTIEVEPTSNASTGEEESEVSNCIICCEPYTNSGEHRLCCLKCGHTYGKFCIDKWLKNETRCPQCNAKASKKDVRVLYVKNLKVLDTAERDRLRIDLEKEREMKRKLELRNTQLDQRVIEMNSKYKTLSDELQFLKDRVGTVYREPFERLQSSSSGIATRSKPLLTILGSLPNKDGDCRVGAYDEWLNMLAVSQMVKSPLYPLGSYGVKKINLFDMRETITTPLHSKEIRDLEFNTHGDVLLSVSLDKKAILTNCHTNVTVQTFNAEYPLWSCAWSQVGPQHTFYAGTSTGQILLYDIRFGREPVKSCSMPSGDRTPVAGLKFVTPSYEKNSGFPMSGVLVQKLTSVWFCEIRNEEMKCHQLPIEGSFLSVDFEPTSRHALISTKASNKDGFAPSRHYVCDLTQYHSSVQQSTMASCNVIQTYDGNETSLAGKMARSSIFSPKKDHVFVAAEVGGGTRHLTSIWNVSETQAQQTVIGREQVLDFVPCRVNNEFLLSSISASNLNIYKVQL